MGLLTREPSADEDAIAQDVIAAAIEVQRTLGSGLAEALYEEALCIELGLMGLVYQRQVPLLLHYKGQPLGTGRLDLLVADNVVVELKSVAAIDRAHLVQMLTYLKGTRCRLGLILNFGCLLSKGGIRRVISTRDAKR